MGSRGRWWRGSTCFRFAIVALAVAGVDTSCYASAPFPVAGVDVLSLRESRPCSGGGRHVLLRKPYRVAAATPVAKNSPQDCFLNAPAFGSTPESNNNEKEEQDSCEPCSSFLVPVAGVEPARCHHQWILSPPRLPIPTHRRLQRSLYNRIQDLFKEKFDIWLCTKIYFVFVMSIFHKGIFCGQNGVGDQTDTSSNCNRNFTCFLGNSKKTCF